MGPTNIFHPFSLVKPPTKSSSNPLLLPLSSHWRRLVLPSSRRRRQTCELRTKTTTSSPLLPPPASALPSSCRRRQTRELRTKTTYSHFLLPPPLPSPQAMRRPRESSDALDAAWSDPTRNQRACLRQAPSWATSGRGQRGAADVLSPPTAASSAAAAGSGQAWGSGGGDGAWQCKSSRQVELPGGGAERGCSHRRLLSRWSRRPSPSLRSGGFVCCVAFPVFFRGEFPAAYLRVECLCIGRRAHTLSPSRHHAVEVEARSNSPACCTVKGLNNHILLHDLSTHSVSICSSAAHVTYPPCKIGLIADKIHILGETDHFSSQFMHWINHA